MALPVALCVLPRPCRAATVTLAWEANTEPDLAGYRVYHATRSLLSDTTAQAAADAGVTKTALASPATSYALSLSYGTTYFFRLTAFDSSGNESEFNVSSVTLLGVEVSTRVPSAPQVDVSSPTPPAGLAASEVSTASFSLAWTASTDDVGVTGYRLDLSTGAGFAPLLAGYADRDMGSVSSSVVTGLAAGTTYYARLRAYDAAGNVSTNSAVASTVTLLPLPGPDTTAPTPPSSPSLGGATTSTLSLSWTASSDDVGVTGYRLDLSTSAGFTPLWAGYSDRDLGSVSSSAVTGLAAGTTYYARLRAYDAAGNVSANSAVASAVTAPPPDTTAPSAPMGLILGGATTSTLSLSWTASSDDVGVTGYRLDLSTSAGFTLLLAGYAGRDLGSVSSSAVTGLAAGTTYYARLRAYDAAGNVSANSAVASAVTAPPPDTTAPSAPMGLILGGATTSTLSLSWTASSDDVGVTGYRLDLSTTAGFTPLWAGYSDRDLGSVSSSAITGLAAGTTYYARLRAYDAAGNVSADSGTASARTTEPPAAAPSVDLGDASLGNRAEVNAATDDLTVRARVVTGSTSAISSVVLECGEVGASSYGRSFVMQASTVAADVWWFSFPSTFTASRTGDLHFRVVAMDAAGRSSASPDRVIRVVNFVSSAPDAQGWAALPNRGVGGGRTAVYFGGLPAGEKPASVEIRQLDPASLPRSSELAAAYEFKANGQPSYLFSRGVPLVLAYPDSDGDGLVDGTTARASLLRVHYFDGVSWRYIGGVVDAAARTVTAMTTHFSTFALLPLADQYSSANVKARENFITPIPQDGFNDVATFGAGARTVDILDLAGRKVFSAASDGNSVATWSGRDSAGRLVESGAYIARLTDFAGGRHYQVIVVAK